jgi:hypothetical protein
MPLINITRIARSQGDPSIIQKGPSSLTGADRLARSLGWFSIGLGIAELAAASQLARLLGLNGKEGLIRAYGAREIVSAVPTLSVDKSVGLASRIAGDVLDIATLASALRPGNPRRGNAALATALVVGITVLDVVAFAAVRSAHQRQKGTQREYSDRNGLPRGIQASRGLARKDFEPPPDYRAEGTVADAIPTGTSRFATGSDGASTTP